MSWKQKFTLEGIRSFNQNSLAHALGIDFTEIGPDYLVATMPVNQNTTQPFGILHGGASVALAETMGSVASTMSIEDLNTHTAVGLEINANHLKSVPSGKMVTATCRGLRVGRQIHVWQIEIRDENGDLSCVSRLTVAIVPHRQK
ncbi:MAG: hotdog fold thioesterase [Saprospiraceae bacterium]|nr:hotdog fold thioesterase [Saprospiraceae bacterium]